MIGAMGGPFTKKISEKIENANVPVYFSVTEWVAAAGTMAKWARLSGNTAK